MTKPALLVTTVLMSLTLLSILIYTTIITELPNTASLKNINYQTPLKIYSHNNVLIDQFGEKKRTPISYNKVPPQLLNAFIASEDQRFYNHHGVDLRGLLRAIFKLVISGKKKQGGSTITMQVARNFLLTREKTYIRKIKEIILALKIENELTKNEILELYINKIFLGRKAYGVVAAAEVYYGKPLAKLSLAQLAMVAGLPKAPSSLNPINDPDRALIRRNYVLNRMLTLGYINQVEFDDAHAQPITASRQKQLSTVTAPYFSDMVRIKVIDLLGDKAYESGLKVYTTLNIKLQKTATSALRNALHNYEERHGYRAEPIDPLRTSQYIGDTILATIKAVNPDQITAQLADKTTIIISRKNFKWALPSQSTNPKNTVEKNFQPDTLVRVRQSRNGQWRLSQEPEVEGALISIDPQTGAIISLVGGFDFKRSKFNRATQLKRQPGSGFKPILYTTALENGYTLASIINDAPIVYESQSNKTEWRPENYSGKFFGPTRLRTALRKSRNLISIRLLREIGIAKIISTAQRFGLSESQLPNNLTLALG
ncbi:MAG: peptidase, partial [Methylococcales bacterium]|nr:peptidase [Methylococcales bacterium]